MLGNPHPTQEQQEDLDDVLEAAVKAKGGRVVWDDPEADTERLDEDVDSRSA